MARTAPLLAALLLRGRAAAAAAQSDGSWGDCLHCRKVEPLEGLLRKQGDLLPGGNDGPASHVHVLWPTMFEVVNLTSDIGGWEDPSFHEAIAEEAIAGWRKFRRDVAGLPRNHKWREGIGEGGAGSLNDAFFAWQSALANVNGDVEQAFREDEDAPSDLRDEEGEGNTTWPSMEGLPAYQRLRRYVDRFSRRYLKRAGVLPGNAEKLATAVEGWVAVNSPGEFHSPHAHVGAYHVAVFYASVGPSAGKLLFGDPRGTAEPFDRSYAHTPLPGQLVIFPAWQVHMATVTRPASSARLSPGQEPLRVVFSFNISPKGGPLSAAHRWSDPLADVGFQRRAPIDVEGMGLRAQ